MPDEDRVIKLLGIDFEKDREHIDINQAGDVFVLSGKTKVQKALERLHDVFSDVVEDGRVKWRDMGHRRQALRAFTESSVALAAEEGLPQQGEDPLRCGAVFLGTLSEESRCGKTAIKMFDAGEPGGYPVCKECAKKCHHARLSSLEKRT
jgi:hypothetical protein